MSGRKAGAMGLVERLAAALAVNEIVRSRRFLGEHTSKEDREELLKASAGAPSASRLSRAASSSRAALKMLRYTRQSLGGHFSASASPRA